MFQKGGGVRLFSPNLSFPKSASQRRPSALYNRLSCFLAPALGGEGRGGNIFWN